LIAAAIITALGGCAFLTGPLLSAHPSTNDAVSADRHPLDGWMLTTDPSTGVSVRMPAQPQEENTTTTIDSDEPFRLGNIR
jgi:hypothetical protein